MECPFCSGAIGSYVITSLPIISHLENDGEPYVSFRYVVAMVECPHCDMVFFLKPDSVKLKSANLLTTDELTANMQRGIKNVSSMTSEEKHDAYEKIKKELIEKFT